MTSFANHPALKGLDREQLAELALYGFRYRALGAVDVDFSKPDRLDVYWTGERMAKKATKNALKANKTGDPLASYRSGEAGGYLQALFNCSVIDSATYNAQYNLLIGRHKTKVS